MQRPVSHGIVESQPHSPQRLATSVMAVGALHLLLVYALISGLYIKIVPLIPHTIVARILPTIDPSPAPPRPPEIPLQQPTLDQVPMPIVKIDNAQLQGTITVARVEHPTGPLPQPSTPIPSTAIVSLMGTHTTPPYPPLSRRLGEEGTVGLRILIADDGRVSDVEIIRSSGQQRLDDAAKQWVRANWRYRAATKDGHAVASETQAVVVFNLKTARR